jgi:hypothetical protein
MTGGFIYHLASLVGTLRHDCNSKESSLLHFNNKLLSNVIMNNLDEDGSPWSAGLPEQKLIVLFIFEWRNTRRSMKKTQIAAISEEIIKSCIAEARQQCCFKDLKTTGRERDGALPTLLL